MYKFECGTTRAVGLNGRSTLLGSAATGLAVMLLATSGAWAQNDQTNNQSSPSVETVTVTGFRASITQALELKQHSQEIVEAVSAEDIGKLPESSIADSLARLPGLASQRDNNGHWQDISVNGLPPSMSATLFNGRPQASTDNNRVIQFDQYPAEIMSAVTVYKTGNASLVNGAIASIDLQTVRPLDYDHTQFEIGAQGEYDTRGSLTADGNPLGGRINASYIDQFAGGKLGVMIGLATMTSPNQIYAQHPYSFNQPYDVVSGLQDQVRSDTLARNAVISTVQWRPSNNFQVTLDGFYSSYNDNAIIRGAEIQTACCGNAIPQSYVQTSAGPPPVPTPPYFPDVWQALLPGSTTPPTTPSEGVSSWIVTPQLMNYDYDNTSKQYSLGGTAVYSSGPWSLSADFGFSEADRKNSRIELYSGYGISPTCVVSGGTNNCTMQNISTATLTAGAGSEGMIGISNWSLPLSNNPNIALGENLSWQQGWWGASNITCVPETVNPQKCDWTPDPAGNATGWPNGPSNTFGSSYGSAYWQQILSEDVIRDTTWRLTRDLDGFFSEMEVGVGYSMRSKNYIDHEGIGALSSANESQAIPSGWLLKPTDLRAFGLPDLVSIDVKKAWASGAYIQLERPDTQVNNWRVEEKVLTPYIMGRIQSHMFGVPMTGNVGVQFVHSDQDVSGLNKQNVSSFCPVVIGTTSNGCPWYVNTFTPYNVDQQYWDILPSLNLTWQVADDKQIRLGVGRSLARPRFDTMGGASNVSFTKGASFPFSGSVANPKLKPWRSDDVDATYEWYYAPGEALFVEGFYKNLESFIYDGVTITDFHPYANLVPAGVTLTDAQWFGPTSSYVNGKGGSLEGVVVGGNFNLSHIADWLDGFGLEAQGTLLSSSVKIPASASNTSPNGQIPELSKFSSNVSFYYEKYGFSFRINDRYRSSYVQEVPNFDGTLQSIEGASENTVDVQLGYQWNSWNFTFSGENLTDTPMNSFLAGDPKHPEYYKLFGTNLLFGVSYKY
jgi:iron complex outermembrane recepter protein